MSDRTTGLVPGLAAVLLFGALVAAILNAEFGAPAGFDLSGEAADTVVHNVGYALFNLEMGSLAPATEGFLAAFLIIAVALDVAVDGALYLAKREDGVSLVSEVRETVTDGGTPVVDTDETVADADGPVADGGGSNGNGADLRDGADRRDGGDR